MPVPRALTLVISCLTVKMDAGLMGHPAIRSALAIQALQLLSKW